jgi:hypothetical protein
MTEALQNLTQCPACSGAGQQSHTYLYRPQHRSDVGSGSVQRPETCPTCNGAGTVNRDTFNGWQQLQALALCPACKGIGGKRYWSWYAAENSTQKSFVFAPCKVCGGNQHVTAEQQQAHERERRKLQVGGVGCAVLTLVVGVCGLMQVVTLLMGITPWFQCCALPNFLVLGALVIGYRFARM